MIIYEHRVPFGGGLFYEILAGILNGSLAPFRPAVTSRDLWRNMRGTWGRLSRFSRMMAYAVAGHC